MVYINENSNIVSFPKNSVESFDKIHFVNQVTKFSFDLFTTDLSDNKLIYTIDISPVIDKFEAGQYDYTFQKNDGTVICSGIIQYEGFTPNVVAYNTKSDYIQYTPDETIYPEADTTITITENDTYNVEDYDTAIVNVKGSGGMSGRVEVVNVNSTPYKPKKGTTPYGESYDTYDRLYADILFNLNCDAKTLYENKDLYVTVSKYSNRRKRQVVINDVIKSDARLKMYCWVVRFNDANKSYWSYFYTPYDYNNDVNQLLNDDGEVWFRRLPNHTERNRDSASYDNNYATYLNQLSNYSALIVSDIVSSPDEVMRYPEGDIDKYFIGDISANPIEKWASEWWGDDEDLNQLIIDEKNDFFNWLSERCVVDRGSDGEPNYAYTTYVGDFPIYPVKLADCHVIVYGEAFKEMLGDYAQLYIKLSELTLEQLELLPQITLVLPFNTNHLIRRLYLPRYQFDYEPIYTRPDILDVDVFYDANKIGGIKRLQTQSNCVGAKTFFKLGICNEDQVKTNNFKDIPQYDFKLITYGTTNATYWDFYGEQRRVAMITRVE